jgi:outer membrane protein
MLPRCRGRTIAVGTLVALGAARPCPLHAQQPITLSQAVALAQQQGLQARAARAARDAARYRHGAFTARLLPQLAVVGNVPSYNRSIIPVLQPDGSTLFRAQQQTNTALTMTLSQQVPITGGNLFVSSSLARLSVRGTQSIDTWSSTPVTVGLRQDVLRPNTARWDRREQTVQADLAERSYLEAMENIAIQTTGAFFDVYAAQVGLENARKNAAVNDTLYTLNTGRFQIGRIGENDLLQSELALLRARTALQGAQLEFDRTVAALRLALNLSPDASLAIAVSTSVPDIEADTARAVAEALRNRAAVSQVALLDVQARRRVAEAKLSSGIGATVQASYGYNATASEARLAYQDLLEARQFTLSVEVPLWQWGAHSRGVRAAEAAQQEEASLSEGTLDQTAHEAHFAALELSQARRTVALSAKADTVAGKRFEVAYNRYLIGRITIDNLYIAQTEKDEALTQFVRAMRGYWVAYYQLRRLTLYDFEAGHPIGTPQ